MSENGYYKTIIGIMTHQQTPKITFLMLVTNRDCIIADFCIKSYQKIYAVKKSFGYKEFTLFIYLNNLSEENKEKYLQKWSNYPFTSIYDNAEKLATMTEKPYPGQIKLSPEGIPRNTEDYTKSCDELWMTLHEKQFMVYLSKETI